MKIYDCFSYFDEDFLLDLRLNILDKYVDYFVIVEGNKTWQNNHKEFNFDIKKFNKFSNKIIYLQVTDLPDGENPWLRENYQRNYIMKGITKANKDDIIIISDLDEIPNPEKFQFFNKKMKYAVFKQMHFYYKLNFLSKQNPYWYGSRICIKKFIKSPQWLRNLKFKKRPFWRIDKYRLNNIIDDGGWHFCNLKSPEKLLYKYQNLCETNDPIVFNQTIQDKFLTVDSIRKKIINGEDLIGKNEEYFRTKLDFRFPEYIVNNKHLFKDWILD